MKTYIAALAAVLSTPSAWAMAPARIAGPVDDAQRVTLAGSRAALAVEDAGALPKSTLLQGVTLVLGRTDEQKADLAQLIAAQHDLSSPLYHRWLTPNQFNQRFGAADADVETAAAWLQSHGLAIESATATRIRFSGTAAQLQTAFGAELRQHADGGFGLSADATVPAALGGLVRGVSNLSSFRPKSHLVKPAFTSSQTGSHFVSPADLAVIYDVKPVYTAGFDGAGQSIAVIGQSAIVLTDIEHFQAAAGVAVHDPQQILVPGTGASTVVGGDEAESDLDLEYTSAIAPGAAIIFVYTGSSKNSGAFDSLQYAIENNVATIISSSYGICEISLGSSNYAQLNDILAQAASQGQSVMSASGDAGSTDCAGDTSVTATQRSSLAVDFPASSQYVTGVGGTEFTSDAVAKGNTTFWTAAPNSTTDVIGSAKSYMPEQVWNDDAATSGFAAGGGGVSIFSDRPTWQTGVTGIPAGTMRLVPDISLTASGVNAGYLFCSGDTAQTGITGSCTTGFRDGGGTNLTVAGGTSFAAPVFSGLVALINQKFSPEGQGVVASNLYALAVSTPAAFHDTTAGGNACAVPSGCSTAGTSGYSATVGYDQASGLGSVDFNQLLAVWPATGATFLPSKITVTAASTTTSLNTNDVITIAVASKGGSSVVPSGTVSVSVDSGVATKVALSAGSASFTFTTGASGTHQVRATYSGDTTYASSSATVSISVPAGKAFGLAAVDTTVANNGTGQATISITPVNGYTGTVNWTVSSAPVLSQGCFSIPATTVTGPATAQLSINAGNSCAATAALESRGSPFTMLGFAAVGLVGLRKRRKWLAAVLFIGAGFTACGGTTVAPTVHDVTGVYVITVTGTDSANSVVNASTTLTLTIH